MELFVVKKLRELWTKVGEINVHIWAYVDDKATIKHKTRRGKCEKPEKKFHMRRHPVISQGKNIHQAVTTE